MQRKYLRKELEKNNVPKDIIDAGFRAYNYLSDTHQCVNGAAYYWDISDAVLETPKAAWNIARQKMQTALALFEARDVFEQRKSDLRYVIKSKLED